MNEGKIPNILTQANITPAFKKGYRDSKVKNHTVSILSVIAKIPEKLLSKVTLFIDQFLSKFQCGVSKGYTAPHVLLATNVRKMETCS